MGKYFFFKTSCEPAVIGITDGTSQVLITDKELERIPWLNELMWWSGRARPININEFHMNLFEGEIRFQVKKKAKLTDVIRYAPPIDGAMIISNRLKQVLEKFNIGKVHFKKVLLLDTAGEILSEDYCLIQVPFLDTNQIDWKNTFFSDSVFDGKGFSPDNHIGYYFNSIEEYRKISEIDVQSGLLSVVSGFIPGGIGVKNTFMANVGLATLDASFDYKLNGSFSSLQMVRRI